jgi:glutaredoxin-related protein
MMKNLKCKNLYNLYLFSIKRFNTNNKTIVETPAFSEKSVDLQEITHNMSETYDLILQNNDLVIAIKDSSYNNYLRLVEKILASYGIKNVSLIFLDQHPGLKTHIQSKYYYERTPLLFVKGRMIGDFFSISEMHNDGYLNGVLKKNKLI